MVKLICSAYRKQYDSSSNALATAALVELLAQAYKVQLVVGSYEAAGEIAVEVTGFYTVQEAHTTADIVCRQFQQRCCLVIDSNGNGSLRGRKTTVDLGKMEFSVSKPATSGWTHYLNGTYLYAPHQAAVQDAKAA